MVSRGGEALNPGLARRRRGEVELCNEVGEIKGCHHGDAAVTRIPHPLERSEQLEVEEQKRQFRKVPHGRLPGIDAVRGLLVISEIHA